MAAPLRPLPGLLLWRSFLTVNEQLVALRLFDDALRRQKRQQGHFDKVITDYREFERDMHALRGSAAVPRTPSRQDEEELFGILTRVQSSVDEALGKSLKWKPQYHVIDLSAKGSIGSHVDSVKFSGGMVTSLSLLSSRVMRLTREGEPQSRFPDTLDLLLEPGTLVAMSGRSRYEYAHAILGGRQMYQGQEINPKRRLSIIQRDELGGPPGPSEIT